MPTIELTDDECYLIERTFDNLYSQFDKNIHTVAHTFLMFGVEFAKEEQARKALIQIMERMYVSSSLHRGISRKFELLRQSKCNQK